MKNETFALIAACAMSTLALIWISWNLSNARDKITTLQSQVDNSQHLSLDSLHKLQTALHKCERDRQDALPTAPVAPAPKVEQKRVTPKPRPRHRVRKRSKRRVEKRVDPPEQPSSREEIKEFQYAPPPRFRHGLKESTPRSLYKYDTY